MRSGSGMSAVSSRAAIASASISLGRQSALRDRFRERARRGGDLLSGAVVEGDDQRQPGVGLRHLLGLAQQVRDVRREIGARANHPHAHIVGVQFREIVADEAMQQRQEGFAPPRAGATSFRPRRNRRSDSRSCSSIAARTARRSASTPRRCPSNRGRPRCAAQRPLPSMISATWRGRAHTLTRHRCA